MRPRVRGSTRHLLPSMGAIWLLVTASGSAAAQGAKQVEAGSEGNAIAITIGNPLDDVAIDGLGLQVTAQPVWVRSLSIGADAQGSLAPAGKRRFTVRFSVAEDAPDGARGDLVLQVLAEPGVFPDRPEVRIQLSATKAPERPAPVASSDGAGPGREPDGADQADDLSAVPLGGEAPVTAGAAAAAGAAGPAATAEMPAGRPGPAAVPTDAARVAVPAVTGLLLPDAVAAIEAAGLSAAVGLGGETSDPALADTIGSQVPGAGALAARGGSVAIEVRTLRVAAGRVPSVVGLPLPEAVALVEGAGFVPVVEIGADTDDPAKDGTISRQGGFFSRPDGTREPVDVALGSEVVLEVYAAVIPGVVVPSLVGKTIDVAQGLLVPNGPDSEDRLFLDPTIEGDAPSPDQEGVILSQYPEPGLEIPRGTTVRVAIYGNYVAPAAASSSGGGGRSLADRRTRASAMGRAPAIMRFPVEIDSIWAETTGAGLRGHAYPIFSHGTAGPRSYSRETGGTVEPRTAEWEDASRPGLHVAAVPYLYSSTSVDSGGGIPAFNLQHVWVSVHWYSVPGSSCTMAELESFDGRPAEYPEYGFRGPVGGAVHQMSLHPSGRAVFARMWLPGNLQRLRSSIAEDNAFRILRSLLEQVEPYAAECQ